MAHGASCTCDACMARDERTFTVWHDEQQHTGGWDANGSPVPCDCAECVRVRALEATVRDLETRLREKEREFAAYRWEMSVKLQYARRGGERGHGWNGKGGK